MSCPPGSQAHSESGLTLLEVVLAVCFSAVVLLGAHAAVETGLFVDRAAGTRFDSAQIARTLSRQFMRDVESARYYSTDANTTVSGEDSTVTFATVTPVPAGGDEVVDQWIVTYAYDSETERLVRTAKPLLAADVASGAVVNAPQSGQPTVATAGGKMSSLTEAESSAANSDEFTQVTVRFEYLQGTEWTDTWPGPGLPAAIKMVYCAEGELGKGRDHAVLARPAV